MQEPTIRFVIPSVVSSHFHIRDGDIVADFGAGVGNFIPELSKRAGPDGRVYACEIQKNLIETLGNIALKKGNHNVHPLWCDLEQERGIKIPDGQVDVGVLINTLSLIEEKDVAIAEIARTLRSGAKLCVIDWTESFGGLGPVPEAVIVAADAIALFEQHGFTFETDFPAGAHHYGLLCRKN